MPLIPRATIPIPPSANRLWRIFGSKMYKHKDYTAWLEHCGWLLARDLPHVKGKPVGVEVHIYGGKGFTKARDIDNCLKPVLDCLRHAGVIEEDNVQVVKWVKGEYHEPESRKAEASCSVGIEILEGRK